MLSQIPLPKRECRQPKPQKCCRDAKYDCGRQQSVAAPCDECAKCKEHSPADKHSDKIVDKWGDVAKQSHKNCIDDDPS